MKMEFKIDVIVDFDGNTGNQIELGRKMDSAMINNLDIMEACSLGILPHDAVVYSISSEADIKFYSEPKSENDEKQS